ncbi:MAG: 30S ribosomal protein S2 [Patescibacteria group bacterium]
MLQKLLDAGAHVGHSKAKGHPKMKPYILTTRQNIQIINVGKTAEKMEEAAAFLESVIAANGVILFVGTKVPAKLLVRDIGVELEMPHVTERWLGGTLTNFSVIQKRLEHFADQLAQKAQGNFEKYSKKEQAVLNQELDRLEQKMGGLRGTLKRIPDALFVVDIAEHISAVREARAKNVPIVAISDTNTDPSLVDYPIPANDRSMMSLKVVLDYCAQAMRRAQEKAKVAGTTETH